MNITITGPRSVGKSTISKLVARKLNLKYISSDEIGNNHLKKHGGLDNAIKSGLIKGFIRKNGYSLINAVFEKKNNFVFDLSGGSVSSRSFPRASAVVRKNAKKNSVVFGLFPTKNVRESAAFLLKREKKRLHFKDSDHGELARSVNRATRKFLPLFKKWADFTIYTKGKSAEQVAKEIVKLVKDKKDK